MYKGMGEERQFVYDNQRQRGMMRLYPIMSFKETQRLSRAWREWGINKKQQQQWREEIDYAMSKSAKGTDNDVP